LIALGFFPLDARIKQQQGARCDKTHNVNRLLGTAALKKEGIHAHMRMNNQYRTLHLCAKIAKKKSASARTVIL
jgi:hypothetical protein